MIIDARVRLPQDLRAGKNEPVRNEYVAQYDAVLNVTESIAKTLADLLQDMEEAGIDHAIVHAEYEYGDVADADNEAVARLVSEHPERFSGFGTVSMEHFRVMRAVSQVQRIAELGLSGVNIQPAFFGMPLDDRRLYPVYAKAAELGLVVALHTGINYSTVHPIKNEHPLLLDQVACDFPELTIIACHSAWPWIPEMVAVARKHPRILMDFGGLSPKYVGVPGTGWEMLYRTMNNVLQNQVLFATDWPVFPINRALREWRAMELKSEVLAKLLGGNCKQLLAGKNKIGGEMK